MRRGDALAAVLFLGLAVLYYQQSSFIVRGFAGDPLGPAFVPQLLAGILTVLSLALLTRAVRGRSESSPLPSARVRVLVATVGLLCLYAWAMPRVGFLLATPVLIMGCLALLGERRPLPAIFAAVGITGALYGVFGRLMGVLLPAGPLGRL